MKKKITVSDYLFNLLRLNGANDIFLVPGGGNMYLIDSVKKNKKLNYINFFHEQTATIAAESYSRKKNKLGVSLVTSGPGSTNAITAVAGAWIESIPLIIVSGQVKSVDIKKNKKIRQNGPQEVNIIDLVKSITKFSVTLNSKMNIPKVLYKCIQEAISMRKGPVWIDIPLDIQSQLIQFPNKKFLKIKKKREKYKLNLKRIEFELNKSKRPILIIGHGVRLSESEKELGKLIKKLNIPFLTTWNAMDLEPYENKLNIGSPGVVARRSSNISIQLSDLIISIGSSLNKVITAFDEKNFGRNAKKIIVDVDKNQLNKINIPRSKKIHCDAKVFIKKLLNIKNPIKPKKEWISECYKLKKAFEDEMLLKKKKSKTLNHYQIVDKLSKILKENQIISTGSSGLGIEIFYTFFKNKKFQRVFLTSGLGSMGYGIPSSIGACLANKKKTILIESDGSLMFNIQELSTIANYKLPIKIIILNNSGYASIRNTQKNYFNSRFVGTGPEDKIYYPTFKYVCKSININYFKINDKKNLDRHLIKYLSGSKPAFIEINLQKNEKLEPKVSSYIDSKNKIRSYPIEDMSPRINSNVLKKYLSIKSINLLNFKK